MKKINVVVLAGGRSAERKISLASGRELINNLDCNKYNSFFVEVPTNTDFNPLLITNLKPDIVFIAMHGPFGEDGTIQGMLDFMGIPYVGSGVLASSLGMNKIYFHKLMQAENIKMPSYFIVKKTSKYEIPKNINLPFMVKPSNQGSSIGVTLVKKEVNFINALKKAFKYSDEILVEQHISGMEVTCGVLGNEDPMVLPLVEIVTEREYFDYDSKYNPNLSKEIIPARLSEKLTKEVGKIAVRVFKALGCKNFARVDIIIKKNTPYVLEINTIPGLTPVSIFPKMANASGLTYSEMLNKLIQLGFENKQKI